MRLPGADDLELLDFVGALEFRTVRSRLGSRRGGEVRFTHHGLPRTRKTTSSAINESAVSTSPAFVAAVHVATRRRISASSRPILFGATG